jgi:hypothetical protein
MNIVLKKGLDERVVFRLTLQIVGEGANWFI